MTEYITISGDTWDSIAYKLYGSELYADKLMEANGDALEYLIFPANVKLLVPDRDSFKAVPSAQDFPDWRSALNGR